MIRTAQNLELFDKELFTMHVTIFDISVAPFWKSFCKWNNYAELSSLPSIHINQNKYHHNSLPYVFNNNLIIFLQKNLHVFILVER